MRRWSERLRFMTYGAAVVLVVAFVSTTSVSCSHAQAYVATGESIDALGKTFLVTGQALDAAYDAHQVSEAQYERWRAFVKYFKPVYDGAADRWLHGDDTAARHAAAVLAALSAELAGYTALTSTGDP